MSAAKDEILGRVRQALRDVDPQRRSAADASPLRDYIRTDSAGGDPLIAAFVERVTEYKATVRRVDAASLPGAIADVLAQRGVRTLVVPADVPPDWLPAGVAILRDPNLTYEQLDTSDGVLTGCALGIAQTGTIVLDGGPAQGRRVLTLLPDYHLCVVRVDQLVGVVPEAVTRLRDSASRPLTWISGPSATSDIELNRVEGVHGPRTLDVLVVG